PRSDCEHDLLPARTAARTALICSAGKFLATDKYFDGNATQIENLRRCGVIEGYRTQPGRPNDRCIARSRGRIAKEDLKVRICNHAGTVSLLIQGEHPDAVRNHLNSSRRTSCATERHRNIHR